MPDFVINMRYYINTALATYEIELTLMNDKWMEYVRVHIYTVGNSLVQRNEFQAIYLLAFMTYVSHVYLISHYVLKIDS